MPTLGSQVQPLVDALELKPGQVLLDLGCGEGRLLKAAAKRGIRGVGYEINPWLYAAARINCWRYRRLVSIKLGNYWHAQWPKADGIFVFLIDRYMPKLDRELKRRITSPTRLVSFAFAIPDKKPAVRGTNFYIYEYGTKSVKA